MEQALYHPVQGYYGPKPRRIGRGGDFYTAVSVGPLYGKLLGHLAEQTYQEMGHPADFVIIEQAAHDGQLAEDILSTVDKPYLIVEPNPRYEAVQRQRLAPFGDRVRWVSSLSAVPAVTAFYLCNELPDAMPVHLVQWDGTAWKELYVQAQEDHRPGLIPGPPSTERLARELTGLPQDLPAGYTTEVNLAAMDWIVELAASPFRGTIYIADYGYDAAELYSPERNTGTIRRYRNHQTDDRVLEDLGECDLTTHVNFTRLIEVAESSGMKQQTYELQGRFLGKLGLPWLAGLEGKMDSETQALLRQYHSLTHPAFMGRLFRVLLLNKA
ncbi:SAM-dependent MidA family methyltransferase [Prosthecobacter fusiformis]|uniref:SAM-dependent MidA family methyltransferase n=1 Tax=Prosthecobacter fusiformis TaxID=48464 RepID=A0A4V3FFL8_9BACT|nr:SAM-dependent methyltransferase [Prosthecobacter fusiformis]TDU71013.1 SAM-dependent MidA family methyltransferase [Prosthecobacter fusiformis]